MASAGQTFAEPREDDSHRAMAWDSGLAAFVGVGFAGPYPFRLALRPSDLTLLLLDRADGVLSVFELPGHSREEAYEWLSVGMATYRGGGLPVIERPEYDLPEHPVGGTAPFTAGQESELATLSALYASASSVLDELFGDMTTASEIRCWPRHFDIATLVTLDPGSGPEDGRAVGVGLAPMGGGYDTWYLYVTPWPSPEAADLPPLDQGRWHINDWTGAVLTGDEISELPEPHRGDRIRRFLAAAFEAARRALDP